MKCCSLLNTCKGSMVEANKCEKCFYALMDKDLQSPCVTCTGYSNFVKGELYMTPPSRSHAAQPLKEAIDEWFAKEEEEHDVVSKPKHYMLFPDKGIEVRDVIEQLVKKIEYYPEGMFIADYVQMMQYLMRFMDKNGVEDLKKARWYLDKMIEAYDEYHL